MLLQPNTKLILVFELWWICQSKKNAGIANTKIRPILSIFINTFGIPRLNWAGVNAVGRNVIRLRLKSRGGKVSQMPFLMMSVFVILTIISLHTHWIQNLVHDRINELFCLIHPGIMT